jgi:hypothetical protein
LTFRLTDYQRLNLESKSGAHFNLEIGMLEQLKGRTFKILKNKNLENYKLENQNLEKGQYVQKGLARRVITLRKSY